MTTTQPPRLSNVELGKLLGLDHSSASRLRRGERGASVHVMLKIEDLLGWSVRSQVAAHSFGHFGVEFERRLAEWTATRRADHDTPTTS